MEENQNRQHVVEESRLHKLIQDLNRGKEDILMARDRAFEMRDQAIAEAQTAKDQILQMKDQAAIEVQAAEARVDQLFLQVNRDHREKCLEVATQYNARFGRLMEIFGFEAFCLG